MGHHPVEDSNRSGNPHSMISSKHAFLVAACLPEPHQQPPLASLAPWLLGSDRLRRKQQFRHIYNSIYRSYNEPRATRL